MGKVAWVPAYVGIGSNLDDPAGRVARAVDALESRHDCRFLVASALYRNPPMGPQDQPDFVNAVAGFLTRLPARDLLTQFQELERLAGRDRADSQHWGPRELDLDLLVYGNQTISEPGLLVPHPGISARNFVLFPLLEIAPGLRVPGVGQVSALARQLDPSGLVRLG